MTDLVEHFTQQIYHEPCPFCGSNKNVYLGHGTVRHCTGCVISWGEGEAETLRQQRRLAVSEASKKKAGMPDAVAKRIKETAKGLAVVSSLPERIKRLRAISDEEWQTAVELDSKQPM